MSVGRQRLTSWLMILRPCGPGPRRGVRRGRRGMSQVSDLGPVLNVQRDTDVTVPDSCATCPSARCSECQHQHCQLGTSSPGGGQR